MTLCTVMIPAHGTPEWTVESYLSVARCTVPRGWRVQVWIGVDGCKATTDTLTRARIPHMLSRRNVGAYVLRNSLVDLALRTTGTDVIVWHDADDVAYPKMLEIYADVLASGADIAGCARLNGGSVRPWSGGVCAITRAAWDATGPFCALRYGSDIDWHRRSTGLIRRGSPEVGFVRRVHPESATQRPETGYRSRMRADIMRELAQRRHWVSRHPLTLCPLEYVSTDAVPA